MDYLKTACILALIFVLGLLAEKLFNPQADLSKCVYLLKNDFCTVVKALVTKEESQEPQESQNIFDEDFQEKMRAPVKPYGAAGMDIDVGWIWNAGLLCIGVHYVPNKPMDEQELQRVTDLLKIAFRRHLTISNVSWRNFAYYVSGPNGGHGRKFCVSDIRQSQEWR